jgi:hypothetical protein
MIKSMSVGLVILASLVSISAAAVASPGSLGGNTIQTQSSTTPKTTAASAGSAKTHSGLQLAGCRRDCL